LPALQGLGHLVLALVGIAHEMADVGDIYDLGDFIAVVFEHPAQRIGEDVRPKIADVGVIVDRRPAVVHAD